MGEVAADAEQRLSYVPIDFELLSPKRGEKRPDNWTSAADDVADEILDTIESDSALGAK